MKKRSLLWGLAALAAGCFPVHAEAVMHDALIDGARLCTRLLPGYERQYQIPKYLLTAIAVTESGRWHEGLKTSVPWPWTVNAQGQGHYFNSKDEAIEFVRDLRRKGVKSMDVGCMQVNLYHHSDAFANLSQAFDPNSNIRYAAQFLRDNYAEARSWKRAAAAYHSKTPELGSDYARRVHQSWKNIVAHVRKRQGGAPQTADIDSRTTPMGEFAMASARDSVSATKTEHRRPLMKVIEVKSGEAPENDATSTHVENGVKVTRTAAPEPAPAVAMPEPPTEPEALSDVGPPEGAAPFNPTDIRTEEEQPTLAAQQASAPVPTSAPKVITVNKSGEAEVKKNGPRFIFD